MGTDSDLTQRGRQAKLGCAPAQKLFDLIKAKKKESVEFPRSYKDYVLTVDIGRLPKGVEIGFGTFEAGNVVLTWNTLPDVLGDWVKLV